jgi:hypothetical protein
LSLAQTKQEHGLSALCFSELRGFDSLYPLHFLSKADCSDLKS